MTAPDPFGLADLPDPLPIEPLAGPLDATVRVPGSKSVTNRALVCAALAGGPSVLQGALFADDTAAMVGVLQALGLDVRTEEREARIEVEGCGGRLPEGGDTAAGSTVLDVRQSGTTARFVLPMLLHGRGSYVVGGHPQLEARPMEDTLSVLPQLGASVGNVTRATGWGRLPKQILVRGRGGAEAIEIAGDRSSQFLSGLLLAAPCFPEGLTIRLTTELVSRPYVDLTLAVMAAFGASVEQPDDRTFVVAPTGYRGTTYAVEPDASAASYPLAAAAIRGGRVKVGGLGPDALQGDAAFADLLAAQGATVTRDAEGTEVVVDGPLTGGSFDLTHLSDTAQSLAVVAPFAGAPTTITGIGFIRRKETDRIAAVAAELRRCGVDVAVDDDGWTIRPGPPHGAVVQTYEDHRMAMSFALLGLRVPGIEIADPRCVAKTFPGYWALLAALARR